VNIKTASDAARVEIARARARAADPKYVDGIPFGLPSFDLATGGIHQGQLDVLIARPNVGKSGLVGQMSLNVAEYMQVNDEYEGMVIRLVLLEMTAESWQRRIACLKANVPIQKIRSGHVTPEQLRRFESAMNEIAELPIEYLEEAHSIDEIERFVRDGNNCAWWVLDHIGQTPGAEDSQTLFRAINQLARVAQRVSPGLVISHQNRQSEMQQDKRPTQSSVAGSDQITKRADRIFGLYREDIYVKVADEDRNKPKPAELIILKNRDGGLGTIHLVFDPSRVAFAENPKLNKAV
jgi:replicative DNA helicase